MDGQTSRDKTRRHGLAMPPGAHPLPRMPSGNFGELGDNIGPTPSHSMTGRRALPQPSGPSLVAEEYTHYRAASPSPESVVQAAPRVPSYGSVTGRRALPKPPGQQPTLTEPPKGFRALPTPPRTYPSGTPPAPPRPAELSYSASGYNSPVPPPRVRPLLPQQPDQVASGLLHTHTSSTPSSSIQGHASPAFAAPSRSSTQSQRTMSTEPTSQETQSSEERKPPSLFIDSAEPDSWLPILERFGDLSATSSEQDPTLKPRDRSGSAVTMKAERAVTPKADNRLDTDPYTSFVSGNDQLGAYRAPPLLQNQSEYLRRHESEVSYNVESQVPTPASIASSPAVTFPSTSHQASSTSLLSPVVQTASHHRTSSDLSPSWTQQTQTPAHWVERKLYMHQSHDPDSMDGDYLEGQPSGYEEEDWEEEEAEVEVDEGRFFQPAFLSEMALQLRDRVPKSRHIKSGIAWVGSFTGTDIVTTINGLLPVHTRENHDDRRFAIMLAQSLQNQLWFVEVDWDIKPLRDSSDDVFRFMGEMEGMGSGSDALTTELPKGLMTMATRCYSPSCTGDWRCYAPRCPYRTPPNSFLPRKDMTPIPTPASIKEGDWKDNIDPFMLRELSDREIARQDIIRQAFNSEMTYEAELTSMEALFIENIRLSDPPIIPDPVHREWFIHEVFDSSLEIRDSSRRLIEEFTLRMMEQPIVRFVGDLFLQAATEWRTIYPEYTGKLPQAEAVLTKELEDNPEFRLFTERVVRENDRRRDVKHLLTRPSAQLQRYPAVIEGILNLTSPTDTDREFLDQALQSMKSISFLSQMKLFHASKGRGAAAKLQWHDLVDKSIIEGMEKKEIKRQNHIWELISGEMVYVADLEAIENVFVDGLRRAEPAIIDRSRLDVFLDEAFHNYRSLLDVHSRLLDSLQRRQLEQHPNIGFISDLIFDAALNWTDAYMEYVTHYPIAKAKVKDEETNNPRFAQFLKQCMKDPATNRQDIYHFINRPIPRLLRYNLLLSDILSCLKLTDPDHIDAEQLPGVMEVIGDLGKATQKGVAINEAKVELWGMQKTLDGSKVGPKIVADLDLQNSMRELIHKGKVYRQPEGSLGGSWTEWTVLLFDHYFVITKEETSSSKKSSRKENRKFMYQINRRPIPLELLSLGNFGDPPRQRNTNRLFGGSSHETSADGQGDTSKLYPFSISFIGEQEPIGGSYTLWTDSHVGGQGQYGGSYTLWTDSYVAREEWKEKLQHAKVLRSEVNDAGKVFEMTPLSVDTFYMPPNYGIAKDKEDQFTGRVTCSCPFTTADHRRLVTVGCQDGVWIGVRGDARSLRKVLHVKNVTGIAVLEEFSIFLCLSDKTLLAYQLEALVPSKEQKQVKAITERITMPREETTYFSVGKVEGRTLLVLMRAETTKSTFRILEPILNNKMEETVRQRRPFGFLGKQSEWFRPYKQFYVPAEVYGVSFLGVQLAILCSKGFETMDLSMLQGSNIPVFDQAKVREKPVLSNLERKCSSGKPLGMFRASLTEFMLIYDTFGVYMKNNGSPSRDFRPVQWEGRHDSVAFHPPYLLLISAPFIEVRHIDTGKLLQIHTGSDIRCTWDGTGGQKSKPILKPGEHGYGDETKIQEPQIHICQRATDHKSGRGQHPVAIGQIVTELSPTLLLNNPLMNPASSVYDSNYVPPPPLTSHATPAIRQVRPLSMVAAQSNGNLFNPNLYQHSNPSQIHELRGQPLQSQPYSSQPSLVQRDSYSRRSSGSRGTGDYRDTQHSRDSGSVRDLNRDSGPYGYGAQPSSLSVQGQYASHQQVAYPQQGVYASQGQAQYGTYPGVLDRHPSIPEYTRQNGYAPEGNEGYGASAIRAWAQGGSYGNGSHQ